MDYAELVARCKAAQLRVMGAFHPGPQDKAPDGTGTLVLLGPEEPGFWNHVTGQPEFQDHTPDPIDRWSERVISALAKDLKATPYFPFGGAPHQPFFTWAIASGAAWSSPVMLLVQDSAGLMVSYRGALAFTKQFALPQPPQNPCAPCPQPCAGACPVGALRPGAYDLDACHAYLDSAEGQDCLTKGCAVRRACPVSQSYGRSQAQSAYHMGVFHK